MKRFFHILFLAICINVPLVSLINIFLELRMAALDIWAWAIITSVIGVALSFAIRYAIKLAKEHQV